MAIRDAEVDEIVRIVIPQVLEKLEQMDESLKRAWAVIAELEKRTPVEMPVIEVTEGESGLLEYDVPLD